jgi:putative acetyltransferase
MRIRSERTGDAGAVRRILLAAFAGQGEADLVDQLRADHALVLALVAEQDRAICGHVAFPRLMVETHDRYDEAVGLAPLAVAPERQRRGIGSALVRAGLRVLAAQGEALVFVLGEPAYYARFGFAVAAARPFASAYSGSHFMALRLGAKAPPAGRLGYPGAFDRLAHGERT